MEKQAILVVSFGTSYTETCKKTVEAIENEIRTKYPGRRFYRAWTSEMIRRKIEKRDGVHISSISEALKEMKKDGIEEILVQATYISAGNEYHKMQEEIRTADMRRIVIGRPLLGNEADCEKAAEILGSMNPQVEKKMLIFMGHGEEHSANECYRLINEIWKSKGRSDLFLGAMEGENSLEAVLNALRENGARKVILAPFMVAAGSHAVKNMAGDNEDSWKTILERNGYETECRLEGLGEYSKIREMFVEHLETALKTER